MIYFIGQRKRRIEAFSVRIPNISFIPTNQTRTILVNVIAMKAQMWVKWAVLRSAVTTRTAVN